MKLTAELLKKLIKEEADKMKIEETPLYNPRAEPTDDSPPKKKFHLLTVIVILNPLFKDEE